MAQKALIINRDPNIRFILAEVLQREGFTLVTADSGQEGFSKFKVSAPDIVVLDAALGDLNAFDLAIEIRKHGNSHKYTPIVVTTTRTDHRFLAACEQAGIDGYLKQPIIPRQFAAYLRQFIPVA